MNSVPKNCHYFIYVFVLLLTLAKPLYSQNIGIGTNNPQEKLHVYDGNMVIQNSIPYLILSDTTPSNGKAGIRFRYQTTNLASITYDIYNDYIQLCSDYTGTRPDLVIDGSGKIGMGILDPATNLHLSGGDFTMDDESPWVILNANTTNTGDAGMYFKNDGVVKGWMYYSMDDELIRLSAETSGTRNDLIVANDGFIGIGTDSPMGELHILGDTVADLFLTPNATGNSYDSQIMLAEDDNNTYGMRIRYDGDANQLRIFGKNSSTIYGPHMSINRDNGNIGIGLVDPSQKLHVSGGDFQIDDLYPWIYLNSSSSGTNSGITFSNINDDEGAIFYSNNTQKLWFSVSPTGGTNPDIVINSSGYVGVGTDTPASQLHVYHANGTSHGLSIQNDYDSDRWHFYVYTTNNLGLFYNNEWRGSFNYTTGAYASVSDRRLKKNIEQLEPVMDKVLQLTPYRYHFNPQDNSDQKYIGLIAQEVAELFPSLVNYQEESDLYSLDYSGFGVLAVKAIQEQQEMINQQKEEIQSLTKLVMEMKSQMDAFKLPGQKVPEKDAEEKD